MIGQKGKYLLQGSLKFLFRTFKSVNSSLLSSKTLNNHSFFQNTRTSKNLLTNNTFSFSTSSPSIAQLQKDVEQTRKQKGENSMQYLQKMHELSFAEAQNNNNERAIQLYETIVKKFEQNIDDKMSPALGDSLENLQMLYKRAGKLMEFIPLTLKLVQIRTKQLGEEHEKVAKQVNQLGVAYYHIGNFDEAVERYKSALRIREKINGKDSLKVIEVRNNLATTLFAKGQHESAKQIFEENIHKIKSLPDFNQKLLITPMTNLTGILQHFKQYKQALQNYQQIVGILKRISTKNTSGLANIYHSMGIVCMKMNNIKKAQSYHNQSLKINKELYGDKHPAVAENLHNLGVCYEAYGQYEKSLESYRKSNEIKANTLGQDHPLLAETYNNMGIVCKLMRNNEESLKAFEKALEILRKQNPAQDTSPIYADLHLNIAMIHLEEQRGEKAVEHFNRAKELYLKFFDPGHIKLAQVYFGLGQYNFMKNNISEAQNYLEMCIASYEKYAPDNPQLYIKHSMKGSCFERQGNFQRAIECFTKSIQCLEKNSSGFPQELKLVNTASLNYQIGDSYYGLNDKAKAKEHYLVAMRIFEQHFSQAYDTLVVVYERVAELEREIGDKEKTKEYFVKTDKALSELLKQNNNHPELMKKQQHLRKLIDECGK